MFQSRRLAGVGFSADGPYVCAHSRGSAVSSEPNTKDADDKGSPNVPLQLKGCSI